MLKVKTDTPGLSHSLIQTKGYITCMRRRIQTTSPKSHSTVTSSVTEFLDNISVPPKCKIRNNAPQHCNDLEVNCLLINKQQS